MRDILEIDEWRFFDSSGEPCLAQERESFVDQLPAVVLEIEEIVDAAMKLKKGRCIPLARPKSYLSRLVYSLGRHAEDCGLDDELRLFLTQRVTEQGGRVNRNMQCIGSNNLFHLCFRAIAIPGLSVKGGELTRLSRGLVAAAGNEVPAEYLIGYLYQTASAAGIPLTPQEVLERSFEDGYDDGPNVVSTPLPDASADEDGQKRAEKEADDDGWGDKYEEDDDHDGWE